METLMPMQTGILGDVDPPTLGDVVEMHRAPYVLRARGGKISKVSAEKVPLPYDPQGHTQSANVCITADGTLYVSQSACACVSTDGGRTWETHPVSAPGLGHWKALDDGTLIFVSVACGEGETGPATVWASADMGRTWDRLTEFPVEVPGGYRERYAHWGLRRLPDQTLIFGMDIRNCVYEYDARDKLPGEHHGRYLSGVNTLIHFHSRDGGRTWDGPFKVIDWGSEGGIAVLPSGRWLASARYQGRPALPSDPPDLPKKLGSPEGGLYKHLFLTHSDDRGRTWQDLRQLTTVFGQCFGTPAALPDGTVVVVHDTRYGPGPRCGRAMISHDEGATWEKEVYYLFCGTAQSGYSHSVVLDDGTILTVAGTSDREDGDPGSWDNWTGYSDLTVIRWRPAKD